MRPAGAGGSDPHIGVTFQPGKRVGPALSTSTDSIGHPAENIPGEGGSPTAQPSLPQIGQFGLPRCGVREAQAAVQIGGSVRGTSADFRHSR